MLEEYLGSLYTVEHYSQDEDDHPSIYLVSSFDFYFIELDVIEACNIEYNPKVDGIVITRVDDIIELSDEMDGELSLYTVEHYFEGGNRHPSIYVVCSDHYPIKEEVIEACNIEYDPKVDGIEIYRRDVIDL